MSPAPDHASPAMGPFDPRLARLHRARAAAGFAEAAFLHVRVAADLDERLQAIPRKFARALVLGAPHLLLDHLSPDVAERIEEFVFADTVGALASFPFPGRCEAAGPGPKNANDPDSVRTLAPNPSKLEFMGPGLGAARQSGNGSVIGSVALEPEHLPFAEQCFDLVVSPLLLHWTNDLPGALVQIRRALKPDGLFLGPLFGGDTLSELRACLIEAEAELRGGAGPRVAPFADMIELAGLLQRAGFALPAADRDKIVVRYAEPLKLLTDLRAMGETSALAAHPGPLTRGVLQRAMQLYRERFADTDGRVRASFEIVTLTGWAPHESQQKALKPGSAKTRLADALGAEEVSLPREDGT